MKLNMIVLCILLVFSNSVIAEAIHSRPNTGTQYKAVPDNIDEQVRSYKSGLKIKKGEIEKITTGMEHIKLKLEEIGNTDEYNQKVNQYNSMLERNRVLTKEYNDIRDKYNNIMRNVPEFSVETAEGYDYFVKLEDWVLGELVVTIFIRGGDTFATRLPAGKYRLKYATGETWHNSDRLFGANTSLYEGSTAVELIADENGGIGQELTLRKVKNGNFKTRPIGPNSW